MPRSSMIRYTCECGTEYTSPVYQTVNVTIEPHLLYQLLAGLLNVAVCPNCGRKTAAALPFVYHDMARGLFAYVHPDADAPEETRERLLERLRDVYDEAVVESERILRQRGATLGAGAPKPTVRRRTPGDDLAARLEPNTPPMQVIFGAENLIALVDSLLEPGERLGRAALSARDAESAARERILTLAHALADRLDLQIETEGVGRDFTVWLYGPRSRVGLLNQRPGDD
jgi:CpXC motif protein